MPVFGKNTGEHFTCEDGDEVLKNIDVNNVEKYEETLEVLTETLNLLEEHECWEVYIGCLNGISVVYYYQRDYIEASKIAEKALAIGKKYGLEQSFNYSVAIAIKSLSVESMGDYEQSIKLQKEALELMKEKEENKEAIAITQENIGSFYYSKGDYKLAISYLEQALQTYKSIASGETQHPEARILMHIGDCYKGQGRIDQALDYYLQSLKIHLQLPQEQFYQQTERLVYKGMVDLYAQLGDQQKANYYIDKAVAIHEKYPGLLMAYQSYLSFGHFYLKEDLFDKAQFYFEAAKQAAHEEYSLYERHPSMALTEAAMGDFYVEKGQWEIAFQQYQKALELISLDFQANTKWDNPLVNQLGDKLVAFEILQTKATALYHYSKSKKEDQGALEKALETHQLIIELIKNVRQGYLIEDSKFDFAEKVAPVYEQAIEVSLALHRLKQDAVYLEQAFLFAEANKAETLYESMASERAKSLAGIPDSLLEEERSIRTALIYSEKNLLEEQQKKEVSQENIQKFENQVFELKEQYLAISQQLEREYPSYFQMKAGNETLTLDNVRSHLNGKMALIEFAVGEQNSYAFFITKKDLKVYPVNTDAAQLSDQVLLLREHVSAPPAYDEKLEDYQAFTKTAHDLYNALLKVGINHLDKRIDRLIIIPDASLSNLPFELLLTASAESNRINYSINSLSYLLKEYALCYQYSARLMGLQNQHGKKLAAENSFIGFAPQFEHSKLQASRDCIDSELSNLRFNREEVSKISELLGGKACLGNDAHLTNFLKEAPHYNIVHLATHACVNEKAAELNRVFFTDSNISQHELATIQLNAELVVLSACNTGVGELLKGEGVMSLARGFMQAGGKSLLTSLWAVDDYATAVQMVSYYEKLMAGLPKDMALKEAKIAYLNQADPDMIHPYYWSSFVQFGKIDEIIEGRNSLWETVLISLILGLGAIGGIWRWKQKQA
ncbi:MAG: CHAT domain-containing protein [Chitinophagales bacterium]|nr:CHAT domain-containing protein [Chitinophagales bacterium]